MTGNRRDGETSYTRSRQLCAGWTALRRQNGGSQTTGSRHVDVGHITVPGPAPCQCAVYRTSAVDPGSQEKTNTEALPLSAMPGPPELPVVGSFLHMWKQGFFEKENIQRAHIMIDKFFREYGPIFRFKVMNFSLVQLKDPVAVQELFRKEGRYPERADIKPFRRYRELSGRPMGVLLSTNKDWQRKRSVMSRPMLRTNHVTAYVSSLDEVSADMVERMRVVQDRAGGTEVPDIAEELFKWSLESICSVLFDERMGYLQDDIPQDARDFIEAMHTIFGTLNELMLPDADVHRFLRTKTWKKAWEAWDTTFRVGGKVMDRKMQEAQEREEKGEQPDGRLEFLSFIGSTGKLTKEEIYSNVIELMGAAIDTTSNTLLWCLYELSRSAELQDKLHREVIQVIGQDKVITWDHLKDLHLLKAIIKETLRMYPVIPIVNRTLHEDIVLMGYKVPAKTSVVAQVYAMGRDPQQFSDPDDFQPERWLRTGEGHDDIHPYSSLPFGFGPRSCIGRRVAEIELQLLLAKISQRYVLEQAEPQQVSPKFETLLVPDRPLRLRLTGRN